MFDILPWGGKKFDSTYAAIKKLSPDGGGGCKAVSSPFLLPRDLKTHGVAQYQQGVLRCSGSSTRVSTMSRCDAGAFWKSSTVRKVGLHKRVCVTINRLCLIFEYC